MIEALLLLFVNPTTTPRTDEFVFKYLIKKEFKTYQACQKHLDKMQYYKEGGSMGVYVEVEGKEKQVAATACIKK